MTEEQPQVLKVPAKAKHQVKIVICTTGSELEKETNKFLETICDERRLSNISFATNMKTGELIHIINYSNISPMTPEEWAEKQDKQKKFSKGFVPENLMPEGASNKGPEVSKL